MKSARCVVLLFFTTLILFLLLPKAAGAVSITIQNPPSSISIDSFTLSVLISGPSAGTNYLRVDLYKDGTSDYFGFTHNGSDFYNGSEFSKYFPITIDSSKSWSGEVKGKIDTDSKSYKGPGEYKLRVRRYTASGGYDSGDANQSAISLVVNGPTLTPSPVPTSPPTDTPKPTPTLKPTATTKPAPTTKPVTQSPSTQSTAQVTNTKTPTSKILSPTLKDEGEVLAASQTGDVIASPSLVPSEPRTATVLADSEKINWPLGVGIIVLGIGVLTGVTILIYKKYYR